MISAFVVDPHPVTRMGVHYLFRNDPHVHIAGEAANVAPLLDDASALPDVVIADVARPELLQAVERLMRRRSLRVIAFADHDGPDLVRRFVAAGGAGYVLKRSPVELLSRAVHAVGAGDTMFDPAVAEGLAMSVAPDPLSGRELAVLQMGAHGMTLKEISRILGTSIRTVETYRARGLGKLGLKTRLEVMRHAWYAGWFDEPLSVA